MTELTRLQLVGLATLCASTSFAQTPISSTFQLGVYADANQTNGGYQQDYLIQSQSGTLNPFGGSISVTDHDALHSGRSLTVRSAGSASWTDASHGLVQWRRMGWDHNTNAQSASKLNSFVVSGPVWSYTFVAAVDSTFTLNYDVRGSGMTFGLLGAMIEWSGTGGGLDLTDPHNPAAVGQFSRAVTGGQTYTIGLSNMGNIFTSLDPRVGSGTLDADFNWSIGPVPEPSSLVALGGLLMMSLRRKQRKEK